MPLNFIQKTNYFGKVFYEAMQMIEYWGFNYIYLQEEGSITRVDMRNHYFTDIAKTPIKYFALATTSYTKPSWIKKEMKRKLVMRHISQNLF